MSSIDEDTTATTTTPTTAIKSREEPAMASPYAYKKPIPAPPPPSPALGALRASPSSIRHLLSRNPIMREWGHQSAPSNLTMYTTTTPPPPPPPISPGTAAASTFSSAGGVPFMPNLVLNHHYHPYHSEHVAKSAMEHAMQEERQRRILKESEEVDMTADQLRHVLREERIRMARFAAELAQLKSTAVTSQLESEVTEEGRINCVLRQLDGAQQEKGRIILELEREEEMLTNKLQKKLDQVKKEKLALEQKIESEQAAFMTLQSSLRSINMSHQGETIEECEDEGEVDDDVLPDLAALAEEKEDLESKSVWPY